MALLRSAAQEASHIASVLRRVHLVEGVPYGQMAVIARGSGRADGLRRLLAQSGLPVRAGAAEVPVREESAVRPLLVLLDEATRIARAEAEGQTHAAHVIDPARAADLLVSPVGGSDAVGLRRLRRVLRHQELAAGGGRTSDSLLAELLQEPARAALLGSVAASAARVATALAAGVHAARLTDDGRSGCRRDRRVDPLGDLAGGRCGRSLASAGALGRAGLRARRP